jgi:NAD+ synthase (glutamine-hydrolysing)
VYAAAGLGESTTDVAWDGQALIYENGQLLAESERFSDEPQLIFADIDLDRIVADRMSTSSYGDSIHDLRDRLAAIRRVEFDLTPARGPLALARRVERFPYVPADPAGRNERCEEVYNIQVRGLETRLSATGIERIVIGVSGGLDSTHALIVAARALDRLGLPRTNVLGYTLPGFATSERTLRNAHALMRSLGVTASELDIRPSATADAARHRPSRGRRRAPIRRHLRERAGGRAHLAPLPPRQPPRRARAGNRRPQRAGARLVARTASATRCRTTTSTRRCPRR